MRRNVWVVVVGCFVVSGFAVGCSSPGARNEVNADAGGDSHNIGIMANVVEAGVPGDGSDGNVDDRGAGGAPATGGSGAGGAFGVGGSNGGGGSTDGAGGSGAAGSGAGGSSAGGNGVGGITGLGGVGSGGSTAGIGGQAAVDGGFPDSPDGAVFDTDVGSLDADVAPDIAPDGEDGTGGNAEWFPDQNTNNSVELVTDPIGEDCGRAQPLFRRSVVNDVSMTGAPGFRLGTAYLLTDDVMFVVLGIPITNTGQDLQCLTGPNTIAWRSSGGQSLIDAPFLRILGSVGVPTGAAQYSSSCLGPGETGLIFSQGATSDDNGDPLDLFGLTNSLVLTLASGQPATRPLGSVVPTSASIDSGGLHVNIKNVGSSPASILVQRSSYYLVEDDLGLPVMLGIVGANPNPNGNLDPAQTGVINDVFAGADFGCGKHLRPFITFGVPSP